MNAAATGRVRRLNNPDVALGLRLLQFLVVCMEVVEFLRQDVRVGDKVKLLTAKTFLHLNIVVAESVLPRDLIAHGEVVDALILVEALIQVALARARRPEDIPLVTLSVREVIDF